MSADFWLGVSAVPIGAAALALAWWIVGKAIGLLRFPILRLPRLHNPAAVIRYLEKSKDSRAFQFSVPGLVVLVIAERKADR